MPEVTPTTRPAPEKPYKPVDQAQFDEIKADIESLPNGTPRVMRISVWSEKEEYAPMDAMMAYRAAKPRAPATREDPPKRSPPESPPKSPLQQVQAHVAGLLKRGRAQSPK